MIYLLDTDGILFSFLFLLLSETINNQLPSQATVQIQGSWTVNKMDEVQVNNNVL